MFKRLMNWFGSSVGSIATKYALRASVAIPFALAGGFAIAGLTVYLIELMGTRNAYLVLAAAFALIGMVSGWLIRWHEKNAEEEAQATEAGRELATTAAQAAVSVPAAILKGTPAASAPATWTQALKGWPLYLIAIGLVLAAGYARPSHGRHL